VTNYYKQAIYDPKESKIGELTMFWSTSPARSPALAAFLAWREGRYRAVRVCENSQETKDDLKNAPGFKYARPAPPGYLRTDNPCLTCSKPHLDARLCLAATGGWLVQRIDAGLHQ
jgi:hypothetical protein